jgi:hypothetical protein
MQRLYIPNTYVSRAGHITRLCLHKSYFPESHYYIIDIQPYIYHC